MYTYSAMYIVTQWYTYVVYLKSDGLEARQTTVLCVPPITPMETFITLEYVVQITE